MHIIPIYDINEKNRKINNFIYILQNAYIVQQTFCRKQKKLIVLKPRSRINVQYTMIHLMLYRNTEILQ